ncbi:MAG: hypothetical protein IJ211_06320 [Campylobacter sp.]|nr:hypothetical protein [Campylobacter sp.]
METILLSIKPEYVKKILSGDKQYEYRRILAKKAVKRIIIYCTYPHMRIVGEVEVKNTISMSPLDLWNATSDKSGIDEKTFFQYFSGSENANAYSLGKVKKYKKPKNLMEFGIKSPPQSFQYIIV